MVVNLQAEVSNALQAGAWSAERAETVSSDELTDLMKCLNELRAALGSQTATELHTDISPSVQTIADLSTIAMRLADIGSSSNDHEITVTLATLRALSTKSHSSISEVERVLLLDEQQVMTSYALSQELVGKIEHVQGRASLYQKSCSDEASGAEQLLEDRQRSEANLRAAFIQSENDLLAEERRIADEENVNRNVFSGFYDWITRSDDQWNIPRSLGFNNEEYRQQAEERRRGKQNALAHGVALLKAAEEDVEAARVKRSQARDIVAAVETAEAEMVQFRSTLLRESERTAALKALFMKIGYMIARVENAIERFKDDTRPDPTKAEIAEKLLGVCAACVDFSEFDDDNLASILAMFEIVKEHVELDDDSDLKSQYQRCEAYVEAYTLLPDYGGGDF